MKKFNVFSLILATLLVIAACGGESEEERMAREQARLDSLRAAEQARVAAMMEQMRQDSIAAAEAGAMEVEPQIEYGFTEEGSFVVQVGAWRSEEKAQWFIDRWADRNYPNAFVIKHGTEENGDIWFRVRVGNFGSREAASAFGGQLAAEINSDYWVTSIE